MGQPMVLQKCIESQETLRRNETSFSIAPYLEQSHIQLEAVYLDLLMCSSHTHTKKRINKMNEQFRKEFSQIFKSRFDSNALLMLTNIYFVVAGNAVHSLIFD